MSKTPEEVASTGRRKPRNVHPINVHFDIPRYTKLSKAAEDEGMMPGKFIMFMVDHYFACKEK